MSAEVRSERPGDVAAIHGLTEAAFCDAPHTNHTEAFIVDALRDAGALAVSLVAEVDGALVGHVALSPVAISDGSAGWYGLGPISVHPAHQRRGIGTRLMHAALDALRARGAAGCVLLGDPAYYARFGFAADAALVLPGVRAEDFQALAFGEQSARGVVAYHAGFEATGPAPPAG